MKKTYMNRIINNALNGLRKEHKYLSTGYSNLDKLIGGGLQPGYLYVLGSRPGMGKTNLVSNITIRILKSGYKVQYFMYQMAEERLVERMIYAMSFGSKDRYNESAKALKNSEFYVSDMLLNCLDDDYSFDVDEDFKDLDIFRDTDLIIIDDLQTIGNLENNPRKICWKLKAMAMRRNIPVILLTGLPSRIDMQGGKKYPMLHDLVGPYEASEFADVVMFLWRADYYDLYTKESHVAQLKVVKNVSAPLGVCRFVHLSDMLRYEPFSYPYGKAVSYEFK